MGRDERIPAGGIFLKNAVSSRKQKFAASPFRTPECIDQVRRGAPGGLLHLSAHFRTWTVSPAADRGYSTYATPSLPVVDLTRGSLPYRFPTLEEPDMVRVLVAVEPRM